MYGTRTIRKVTAWLTEDIPNWFTVKWNQVKDFARQIFTVVGVVGGFVSVVGYMVHFGGVVKGLSELGKDLFSVFDWLGLSENVMAGDINQEKIGSAVLGRLLEEYAN